MHVDVEVSCTALLTAKDELAACYVAGCILDEYLDGVNG